MPSACYYDVTVIVDGDRKYEHVDVLISAVNGGDAAMWARALHSDRRAEWVDTLLRFSSTTTKNDEGKVTLKGTSAKFLPGGEEMSEASWVIQL